ncbi:MAG: 30S ribosomal protein S4e [Candidatus Brockarchaeota archaeon]|nr:30S ribosomal protein S4e [Candidatus Brockarchaeota archaeon]
MGSKGGSRHLKRLAAPRSWSIGRKEKKFIEKPSPGPHPLASSVTLGFLLTSVFKYCKTAKEARRVLKSGLVRVDGLARRTTDFPIGLMDVVEFPTIGEAYRMLVGARQRLLPVKIGAEEKSFKLCRIESKKVVKGGLFSYGLHDGRTCLQPKEQEAFAPGWSLKIGLPEGELQGHVRLQEGAVAGAIAGKNCGRWGVIEEIIPPKAGAEGLARIGPFQGERYLAPLRYVFVVGDSKPWIKLPAGAPG